MYNQPVLFAMRQPHYTISAALDGTAHNRAIYHPYTIYDIPCYGYKTHHPHNTTTHRGTYKINECQSICNGWKSIWMGRTKMLSFDSPPPSNQLANSDDVVELGGMSCRSRLTFVGRFHKYQKQKTHSCQRKTRTEPNREGRRRRKKRKKMANKNLGAFGPTLMAFKHPANIQLFGKTTDGTLTKQIEMSTLDGRPRWNWNEANNIIIWASISAWMLLCELLLLCYWKRHNKYLRMGCSRLLSVGQ